MFSDEPEIDELQKQIDELYEGKTENKQQTLIDKYGKNPDKFEFLLKLLENPDCSPRMIHFAVTSLTSLLTIIFKQKNEDFFSSLQTSIFAILFERGPDLENFCIDSFCKFYGTLFSCLFRRVEGLQLTTDNINFFFDSDNPKHKEIGFNLCMNVIISMQKVLQLVAYSDEKTLFVKETTLLTCFNIAITSIISGEYFSNLDIMKSIFCLLNSCLKFDEDITQTVTKIYFPENENWIGTLQNLPSLFNSIAVFFNNYISDDTHAQKYVLDSLSYLILVRIDHQIHIECLNILLPMMIAILQSKPLVTNIDIIDNIINIIVQTSKIILVSDIEFIQSYEEYVTNINEFTLEFSDPSVCMPNFQRFMELMEFWKNLKIDNPFSQPLNSLLYDVINQLASAGFNLIKEFDFHQTISFMSLFWQIGNINYYEDQESDEAGKEMNEVNPGIQENEEKSETNVEFQDDEDKKKIDALISKQYPKEPSLLQKILKSFDEIQNELYDLYKPPKNGQEIDVTVFNRILELQLLAIYHALILGVPIIRNITVDKSSIDYAMISILSFFIKSMESVTKLRPVIVEILGNENFELVELENTVLYLISQMEKDPYPLKKSFTSSVVFYFDCYFIQKKTGNFVNNLSNLHTFFLRRILSIPKAYRTDSPIVSRVFRSIIHFDSLDSKGNTIISLSKELLNGFLYRMKLHPGQRLNNFYGREWEKCVHYDFHRLFASLMSKASIQPEFASIKTDFIYLFRDLKLRISNLIYLDGKVTVALENSSNIVDLAGIDIKAKNELEMSSNLLNLVGLNFETIFSEETHSYLIQLPDLDIKAKIVERLNSHLIDLIGLLKTIDNSTVYSIFYDHFFDFIQKFRRLNLDQNDLLRFLYEFSEDRNGRITKFVESQTNQISEPLKGKQKPKGKEKVLLFKNNQQYQFRSLLFFKEAGLDVINFFTQFKIDPMNNFPVLKYAYRIISNLFNQFSSSIGAFKLYNDQQIYNELLTEYLFNFSLFEKLEFNFQPYDNLKLTKSILNSVIACGSTASFFDDICEKNPTYFKTSLFIIAQLLNEIDQRPIIRDNKDQWEELFDGIFHALSLIASFFVSRRKTKIEAVLFDKQNLEYFQLLLDGLLQIIEKNFQFYGPNFLKLISILNQIIPFGEVHQEILKRLHDIYFESDSEEEEDQE